MTDDNKDVASLRAKRLLMETELEIANEDLILAKLENKVRYVQNQAKRLRAIPNDKLKECIICCEHAQFTHIPVPCGHRSYCLQCLKRLKHCSLCNASIHTRMEVYE